jgi:predicted Zn finger-like uncharacterized protein
MIEIQCTSCHTRYRIDERVLPDETPTFKCSRCGHVFTAEPVRTRPRKPASANPDESPTEEPPARKRFVFDDVADKAQRAQAQQPKAEPPEEPALKFEEPPPPPEKKIEEILPEAESPIIFADTREPAPEPKRPSTDEIFNKSFAEQPRPDTGENLKFDFADERHQVEDEDTHEIPQPEEDRWQVGDAPEIEPTSLRARPGLDIESDADRDERKPAPAQSRPAPPQKFYQPLDTTSTREAAAPRPYIPDDVAFIEDTSPVRSSSWFLGMFFLVAVAFFALSMLINGAPGASINAISRIPGIGSRFAPPATPATTVKLGDVRSEYRTLKGGKSALVVTGNAENISAETLHAIGIEVLLLNKSQRAVARAQTYCGNTLAAGMFDEMTPRELEFSLGLTPPKNFTLDPSQATPFMLVFVDPPPQADSLRIAVTQADPTAAANEPRS